MRALEEQREQETIREQWLDGPDSEAKRAVRAPNPTRRAAVRRTVAYIPASDNGFEVIEDPGDAYRIEVDLRLEATLCARGDYYWPWRIRVGHEHAMAVGERWASILRRQDEKAGYR